MLNSMSSSSSYLITLKEGAAAAISSSDISNGFSCRFLSFRFSICVFNKAFHAAHFLPSLKHEIKSPCVPSIANARPHELIDLANVSLDLSCQDLVTHSTTSLLGTGFIFPVSVYSCFPFAFSFGLI